MFISTEIRLDIGFSAAQDKLADLSRDGLLGDAYPVTRTTNGKLAWSAPPRG